MQKTSSTSPQFGQLGIVTVSYQPDIEILQQQLNTLPVDAFKVVVDNASPAETKAALNTFLAHIPNSILIGNDKNLGLATALNQGVRYLSEQAPQCLFVLLLDQDSTPEPGSIEQLLSAWTTLQTSEQRLGAIGPQLREAHTDLFHGFHQMTRWHWKRIYPSSDQREPVSVANLNGSGTLMPLRLFLEIGCLDDDLFIDHIDTEWSFRLRAKGYSLWGIPQSVFTHRMGERGLRFWLLGWRVWPWRSPIRHQYLFRNTLLLMRRDYVPTVWKVWAVVKLLLTACVFAIGDPRRAAQVKAMWRGIRQGTTLRKPTT